MWLATILVAMISMTGYYALSDQGRTVGSAQISGPHLATNMAAYRIAVVSYATDHPVAPAGAVSASDLAPYLPNWFPNVTPSPWANWLAADGTITIYSTANLATPITSDVVRLSQESKLVGVASSSNTLWSPIFGDTLIPLPMLGFGTPVIPSGRLVWMAHRS